MDINDDRSSHTDLDGLPLHESRSFWASHGKQFAVHVWYGLKLFVSHSWDWLCASEFHEEIMKARQKEQYEMVRKKKEQMLTARSDRFKKLLWALVIIAVILYLIHRIIGDLIMLSMICIPFFFWLQAKKHREEIPELKQAEEKDTKPFPIAFAVNEETAIECLRRALVAEGIHPQEINNCVKFPWGWEFTLFLEKGTPEDVSAKMADMETLLGLPADGFLMTTTRFRAKMTISLVETDPFAGMPEAPDVAPLSRSIKDKHVVAKRMDGSDLSLGLLRVHGLIISAPGGGKSMFIRQLAEITTSCYDCLTWDADAGGSGLEVFGDAIDRSARSRIEIEEMLADALDMAKARARMLIKLGMGDNWQPTASHPAVVIFIDEFIQLSTKARDLAIDVVRVGRKAGVTVILAAQEATKGALGAAIANSVALRVMFASRQEDIMRVFGTGSAAEGWRPDRLHPASGDDPEDAGRCYIRGSGAKSPVQYKSYMISPGAAIAMGQQRALAGRPELDKDTRDGMVSERNNMVDSLLQIFDDEMEDWLPSSVLCRAANLTAKQLAETLGEQGRESRHFRDSKYKIAGYTRDSIEERLVD